MNIIFKCLVLLLMFALPVTGPAFANSAPIKGEWSVKRYGNECYMTARYVDGTTASIVLKDNDSQMQIHFSNQNWAEEEGEVRAAIAINDPRKISFPAIAGVLLVLRGKNKRGESVIVPSRRTIFTASNSNKLFVQISRGSRIAATFGNKDRTTNWLSLKGSAIAIKKLKKCNSLK